MIQLANMGKSLLLFLPLAWLCVGAVALAEYHSKSPTENYHCDKLSGKRFACVGGAP